MNSFSITPYEHQQIIETYKQWLVNDLYQNFHILDINDPNFLKKLSIIQAEGIRHDIALYAAVTHSGIKSSSDNIAKRMQSAATLITSSLDDGFSMLNQRMYELNDTLHIVNANIIEGNRLQAKNIQEVQTLNKNMIIALSAINSNISQSTNILKYQTQQATNVLNAILDELRIPESQRERRYHIEEGVKFFNMGMKTGDCLYFEDALDEFNTAISIEKKDFFSWYYIGMVHLYSKNHIDIEKAKSSFERYFHYAAALPQRHELFDDAIIMKAECYYLEHNLNDAYKTIEPIINENIKASLRGVKYLSASGEADKQIFAVSILRSLIDKNPYHFMQVLEDNDIVNNDYIVSYIKEYKSEVDKEIQDVIESYRRELNILKKFPSSYIQDINNEVNNLINCVNRDTNNIGVVDAVIVKERLLNNGIIDKIRNVGVDALRKINAEKRIITLQNKAAEEKRREREYLKAHGYVDLGLPSGTLWKKENEKGFYEIGKTMKNLPSENQWRELLDKCDWSRSWLSGGFKIVGPNGASIFLPASGIWLDLDDDRWTIYDKGKRANYLSCTEHFVKDDEGDDRRCLAIFWMVKSDVGISNALLNCDKYLVRLAF